VGDIHLATGTGEQPATVTAEESVDAAALDMERETARTQHEVRGRGYESLTWVLGETVH
jgi:hypothetical protein